jgi:hypothetical protein
MAGNPSTSITEADINSVAQKLQDFAEGLTESEQAVLAWLIQRAASGDEVSGYGVSPLEPHAIKEAVLEGLGFAVPR